MRQGSKTIEPDDQSGATKASDRVITVAGQRLDSRQLFLDGREIMIVHGQDTYRLRLTAQNKLILTK